SDPATKTLTDAARLVPGTYEALLQASGYGTTRLTLTIRADHVTPIDVELEPNLSSATRGATATGAGVNLEALIDDTESTDWRADSAPGATVEGLQATVALAPSVPAAPYLIDRVQVSAMTRPPLAGNPDAGVQSVFTALRSFEILTCV